MHAAPCEEEDEYNDLLLFLLGKPSSSSQAKRLNTECFWTCACNTIMQYTCILYA